MSNGPLRDVTVIELAAIGPAPFAAMMLADLGADVIRVDRPGAVITSSTGPHPDVVLRNRRSVAIDLKSLAGRDIVLDLVASADILLEGFRPGVTERLGLGPTDCLARNPTLVYGRMTGWGQNGPLAQSSGHDITYLAPTGALDGSRRRGDRPVAPMNLLGDLGGGATFLAFGVVSAVLHARRTGEGQVVDAAIVDGTALLTNFIHGLRAQGLWSAEPGGNVLDGGAPYYDTYRCSDGKEVALGALEPQFYAQLVERTGIEQIPELTPELREDPAHWPRARQAWAELFARRTRDEWTALLEGSDACVAPVLSWDEARHHRHLVARATFEEHAGAVHVAPAPRFDRTPGAITRVPAMPGHHTDEILTQWGRSVAQIGALRAAGVVA